MFQWHELLHWPFSPVQLESQILLFYWGPPMWHYSLRGHVGFTRLNPSLAAPCSVTLLS